MVYSSKVIDHFTHPRNIGKMKNPDAAGEAGNPVCGDLMTIYLKIGKRKVAGSPRVRVEASKTEEFIKDIKFETLGCAAAIATSSMVTELAMGKTLEDAMKITRMQVADELGSLPPIKMHCSNLAAEALHKAIEEYRKKK
ncbi:MAG: iron-sulfur cluster assembly scaffold protein [bacterium]|nr:iron-sulfur cluster assembly scaffold protein [bacterium]